MAGTSPAGSTAGAAPLDGDAAYVGMEIQVLDDSGSMYTNLLPGQYHGSICKVAPAKRGFQKPVGEWNSEEITAGHIGFLGHGAHVEFRNLRIKVL